MSSAMHESQQGMEFKPRMFTIEDTHPMANTSEERKLEKPRDITDDESETTTKADNSTSRRGSDFWNSNIEKKKREVHGKARSKKNQQQQQLNVDEDDDELPTSAVVSSANVAVQYWRKHSHGMSGDSNEDANQSPPAAMSEANKSSSPKSASSANSKLSLNHQEMTPEEETNERRKKRNIPLLFGMCALILILTFGLMFGLKGNDDNFSGTAESSVAPVIDPNSTTTIPYSAPTVASPTSNPSVLMEETNHEVNLILNNLPEGYTLTDEVQNSIIAFVKNMLQKNLDEAVELVDVVFNKIESRDENIFRSLSLSQKIQLINLSQNTLQSLGQQRRLASVDVPILITVKGPAGMSDMHLPRIMGVLKEDGSELYTHLRSLDPDTFGNVGILLESESRESHNGVSTVGSPSLSAATSLAAAVPVKDPVITPPSPNGGITPASTIASPTNSPSIRIEETSHQVRLILNNVPEGYTMTNQDRNSIIAFVKDMLQKDLDGSVELVNVALNVASGNRSRLRALSSPRPLQSTKQPRRLASVDVPILITVKGPADTSRLHLMYIMGVLKDGSDLFTYLRSLDVDAYRDVGISFESKVYEPDSGTITPTTSLTLGSPKSDALATDTAMLTKPTLTLTGKPTYRPPSRPPTPRPIIAQSTPKPTGGNPQACDNDTFTCADGTIVSRNPFQMCIFFSCSKDEASKTQPPTSLPPSNPTVILLDYISTSKPTSTTLITNSPSSQPVLPPSPPPTTQPPTARPISPLSTISPTLKPSTDVSLVCSPDPPMPQCDGAALKLLEKCSSSDTVTNDQFGHAIAMATRYNNQVYAIVGARNHDKTGSAHLIKYDRASKQWNHIVEIIPGGASANGGFDGSDVNSSYDQFGYAVAISRDWVAISAPFDTASTGKVSLFWLDSLGDGDQLEPDAELIPADIEYGARFGSSLALDGDTLVVGAMKDNEKIGSAYVYKYNVGRNDWQQIAKLEPDDATSDSQGNFGQSVAIAQGTVIVGAPFDGTNGRRRNGSVFVYFESTSGLYVPVQKIVPFDLLEGDNFGFSIAVSNSVNPLTNIKEMHIAIGARFDDDRGQDSGSVYMYRKIDGESVFTFEQKLVPFDWSPGAELGSSVAMNAHRVIVGAKKKDGVGGAYYFKYDGSSWQDMEIITPSNRNDDDDFGSAVALTSEIVVVGSHSNDEVGEDGGILYSYAVCN